jgi:hypothetical protein
VIDGERRHTSGPAPTLGRDTERVLAGAGLSSEEITGLISAGVAPRA